MLLAQVPQRLNDQTADTIGWSHATRRDNTLSRASRLPRSRKRRGVSALANHRPGGVGEQPGVTFAPGKIAAIMSGLLTAIAIALRTSGSHSPFPRALEI